MILPNLWGFVMKPDCWDGTQTSGPVGPSLSEVRELGTRNRFLSAFKKMRERERRERKKTKTSTVEQILPKGKFIPFEEIFFILKSHPSSISGVEIFFFLRSEDLVAGDWLLIASLGRTISF